MICICITCVTQHYLICVNKYSETRWPKVRKLQNSTLNPSTHDVFEDVVKIVHYFYDTIEAVFEELIVINLDLMKVLQKLASY